MNIDSVFLPEASADRALFEPPSGKILGANDFIRLLSVQLANQDPLEPMKDTAFIAQMASFSSLERMKDLSIAFQQFSQEQQKIQAQNYLGKEVALINGEGAEISGVVTAVSNFEGKTRVSVGGEDFPVESIVSVRISNSSSAGS